jgi:hypothetical protein
MQDLGYELPRIPILRGWVNRPRVTRSPCAKRLPNLKIHRQFIVTYYAASETNDGGKRATKSGNEYLDD